MGRSLDFTTGGSIAGRKFPVDMAGFAVNVKFLLQRPNATMPFKAGYEEDGFLKSLAPFEPKDIEFLADNCTKVLAWHTQTKKNEPSAPLDMKLYGETNLVKLKQQIVWCWTRDYDMSLTTGDFTVRGGFPSCLDGAVMKIIRD